MIPGRFRRRGALPALLVALVVLALGLTTYTQSVFNPGPAQTVEEMIQRTLGDTLPRLPAYDATRSGLAITGDSGQRPPPPPIATEAAVTEVAQLAGQDSSALRAWLSPFVLRWAWRSRDTVHLTFVRLTRHAGCPLVSRLDAVLSDARLDAERLLGITTTCPGP